MNIERMFDYHSCTHAHTMDDLMIAVDVFERVGKEQGRCQTEF